MSLYEIITAFKDESRQNANADSKLSELVEKSPSMQLYDSGYRHDFERKILWDISNPDNRKATLTEVSQATLGKESTQEKKIIDITSTSGLQSILIIEGKKHSIILQGDNQTTQARDNKLYLSDLRYNQEILINRTAPYMEVTMTRYNFIDLSKCSRRDIDRINERTNYTEGHIQRQGNNLIIYSPDYKHADNFLSAFKREKPIEDKLEKIKINYELNGQQQTGELFWLSAGYEAHYGEATPRVNLSRFINQIRFITLALYKNNKLIVYDYGEKKLFITIGSNPKKTLCENVNKVQRENTKIIFRTHDHLSWEFNTEEEYMHQEKYKLHLNHISKEYLQDKPDYTSSQLLDALKKAETSLMASQSWYEVKLPEKVQYNKKNNILCSFYNLDKTFDKDPTILNINDKIIFLESNRANIYNYQNKILKPTNIKRPTSDICVSGEKIIFFGDWDGNKYTPNIKIYDVNTDTQVKETPPIKARGWTSTISLGDKAIFFGGWSDKTYSANIDIYNNNTERWETATHETEGRSIALSAVVGNKAIFFGGWKGNGVPSSAIDIYDNDKDVWKTVDQRDYNPQARATASVAVVGNKAIFFGGRKEKDTPLSAIDIYDGDTGIWKTVKQKDYNPQARTTASVAVVGNKAVFFGGRKKPGDKTLSAIDIYDNDTDKWKTVDQRGYNPQARIYASTVVIGNKAVFFGGIMCKNPFIFGDEDCYLSDHIDIYDAESDRWTNFRIDGPALKAGHIAFVKGSKTVFVGVALDGTAKMYEIELLASDVI